MGIRNLPTGREEMFLDNWRHVAAGTVIMFVIGAAVGGVLVGLGVAVMIVFFALVALAIGD